MQLVCEDAKYPSSIYCLALTCVEDCGGGGDQTISVHRALTTSQRLDTLTSIPTTRSMKAQHPETLRFNLLDFEDS